MRERERESHYQDLAAERIVLSGGPISQSLAQLMMGSASTALVDEKLHAAAAKLAKIVSKNMVRCSLRCAQLTVSSRNVLQADLALGSVDGGADSTFLVFSAKFWGSLHNFAAKRRFRNFRALCVPLRNDVSSRSVHRRVKKKSLTMPVYVAEYCYSSGR